MGVMGAKDGALVIAPAAAGPWPFVGTVICARRVWRGGQEHLRNPLLAFIYLGLNRTRVLHEAEETRNLERIGR
jgi:hypothetical protein